MEPKLKEFYVPVRNNIPAHRIAYTEWGEGPKALFCIHGLARNSRDFDFLAKELAKNYRVICVDIAGRGKSEWLEDKLQYNYFTYVSDILALVEHLQLEKIDWVGTSMGGLIGVFTSLFAPKLINNMVLNDIGPFMPKDALQRIAKYVGLVPEFTNLDQAERHFRTILAPFGIEKDEHWRHVVLHGTMTNSRGYLTTACDPGIATAFFYGKAIHEITDVEIWKDWDKLDLPILVIRGGESDILLGDTTTKMLHKPKVELAVLEHVGHAPALMNEHQINLIKNWLIK